MSRGPSRSRGGETDDRLVELVRAGDERAFELIVRRYSGTLRSTCRRLGLSPSKAEDALQQTFLSAWLALRRGDEVRELGAWLRRIAHNKAVNILRGPIEADMAAQDSEPWDAERPALAQIEQRLAVRQALSDIAALPDMQRDALLMSAVDGRSYEEVSRALGVSQGAVRGLLHRARASLRESAAAVAGLPFLRWLDWGRGPAAGQALGLAGATGADGGAGAGIARVIATAAGTLAVLAGVTVGPLHHLLAPARHPHGSRLSSSASAAGTGRGATAAPAAGVAAGLSASAAGAGSRSAPQAGSGRTGSDQTSPGGGRALVRSSPQAGRSRPSRRQSASRPSIPRSAYSPSEGNGEASVPAAVGTAASSSPQPASSTPVTAPAETPAAATPPLESVPAPPVETAPKQKAEGPTDDPPEQEHEKEPAPGETRTPEEPRDR